MFEIIDFKPHRFKIHSVNQQVEFHWVSNSSGWGNSVSLLTYELLMRLRINILAIEDVFHVSIASSRHEGGGGGFVEIVPVIPNPRHS